MIATIIFLSLMVLQLLVSAVKHGSTKRHCKYDFRLELFNVVITLILLYYMGVFNNF